jgi:hypothetical protein
MIKGDEVGRAFKVDPNCKYIVFVNENKVDMGSFCREDRSLLPNTVIYGVHMSRDDTMDDVIRIYEVK